MEVESGFAGSCTGVRADYHPVVSVRWFRSFALRIRGKLVVTRKMGGRIGLECSSSATAVDGERRSRIWEAWGVYPVIEDFIYCDSSQRRRAMGLLQIGGGLGIFVDGSGWRRWSLATLGSRGVLDFVVFFLFLGAPLQFGQDSCPRILVVRACTRTCTSSLSRATAKHRYGEGRHHE